MLVFGAGVARFIGIVGKAALFTRGTIGGRANIHAQGAAIVFLPNFGGRSGLQKVLF
jgi:hypothetical protein